MALEIQTFLTGPLETNTYLLAMAHECWVIDPGMAPRELIRQIKARQTCPSRIVLTHGHGWTQAGDGAHVGGRQSLAQREDLQETPPRFVVERVKDQRRLARPGHAGDHGQPVADLNIDVSEVVLACPFDADSHRREYHSLPALKASPHDRRSHMHRDSGT